MWTYFSSRQWFDWPSTAEIVFPSPIAYSDSQVLCPSAAKHTSKYINPNHKKIKQTFQADDSHHTLQQCTFLLQGPCVYPIFMPTLTGPWHNFSERVCVCATYWSTHKTCTGLCLSGLNRCVTVCGNAFRLLRPLSRKRHVLDWDYFASSLCVKMWANECNASYKELCACCHYHLILSKEARAHVWSNNSYLPHRSSFFVCMCLNTRFLVYDQHG